MPKDSGINIVSLGTPFGTVGFRTRGLAPPGSAFLASVGQRMALWVCR